MISELLFIGAGVTIGWLSHKFIYSNKRGNIDTDFCLKYLRDRGYWITLNSGLPRPKERQYD